MELPWKWIVFRLYLNLQIRQYLVFTCLFNWFEDVSISGIFTTFIMNDKPVFLFVEQTQGSRKGLHPVFWSVRVRVRARSWNINIPKPINNTFIQLYLLYCSINKSLIVLVWVAHNTAYNIFSAYININIDIYKTPKMIDLINIQHSVAKHTSH